MMRFPKNKLVINEYNDKIKSILNDNTCHIFIDTNIISQLFRLNDKARNDFYRWVELCKERFHIPVWVVHEYYKRVVSQKTTDYLPELSTIKKYANEIERISPFIKGYVGDFMLAGSVYQNKVGNLFSDIDRVNELLKNVSVAINKKTAEHILCVENEIVEKLENFSMKSDIYKIIDNLKYDCRYLGKIPPGFEDDGKKQNEFGDLIIWKEILEYCKNNDVNKAILISRDVKNDMVYCPEKQTIYDKPVHNDQKLHIAHESLIHEFSLATKHDDFYIIDFCYLVKTLASEYRDLATSFQLATAEEKECEMCDIQTENYDNNNIINSQINKPVQKTDTQQLNNDTEEPDYRGDAFIDSQYYPNDGIVDNTIIELKSYNWYRQNPAIVELLRLSFTDANNTQDNRTSFFVLGRNILQSAEGSSANAISFVENLYANIKKWPDCFKRSFVDGLLYEVFFNSDGIIRNGSFKATFIKEIIENIEKFGDKHYYDFINKSLKSKGKSRFYPYVGSTEKYSFKFYTDKNDCTTKVECNGSDISATYPHRLYAGEFSTFTQLKEKLSKYYAILCEYIDIDGLNSNIGLVTNILIAESQINYDELPF